MKPIDFENALIVTPSADVDGKFATAVEPMHREAWELRVTADRLSQMRDLLLPKLVTGEIDVSNLDLDALVEAGS